MTTPTAPAEDIPLPALHKGIDSGLAVGLRAYARRAILADRASPSRSAWIDVAARLPESGKAVLLDIGKKTPIRALWAAKATVEAGDDADDSWVEYDESSGTTYCPEGWYEWNEHEETHWAVSATPLRWMSIPVPAAVDVGAAQAETAQAAPDTVLLPRAEWEALDYWLDRCESKGHLERCSDLIEPYEALCKAIAARATQQGATP